LDSPSNGAAVVDSAEQSYQSSIYDVAGCESFPGTENIAAGDKGLGCVVFQVPDGAKITKLQFTLDFGPMRRAGGPCVADARAARSTSSVSGLAGRSAAPAKLPATAATLAASRPARPGRIGRGTAQAATEPLSGARPGIDR
jgi:hypothetical protein